MIRHFAVVAFLLLLGLGVVAKANTSNTFNVAATSNAQLTFYATDSLGYLEFLDLANQSGDIILTQGQTLTLNVSQSYIVLFVPYNATTQFQSWTVEGNATLSDNQYMTNMTLYGNTTLVAIATSPAIPVPEFPSNYFVMLLAFTVVLGAIFRRKEAACSSASKPVSEKSSLLRGSVWGGRIAAPQQTAQSGRNL